VIEMTDLTHMTQEIDMARKPTAKQIETAQRKLVEQIYYKNCSGMQINVLKIGTLFKLAGKMLDDGAELPAIVNAMWGFAENPQARVS
jgi:hypothetical protein